MRKIITFCNHKGGTGKTTVALHLGAALNHKLNRVLLIDLDPQAAMTFSLLGNERARALEYSTCDLLLGAIEKPIEINKGLDLIPATFELDSIENKRIAGKERLLQEALTSFKDYRYILIDTPPAVSQFLIMAILASSSIYTVVNAELLSYRSLIDIEDVIKGIKARVKKGVIVNLYDRRRRFEKEMFSYFKEYYKGIAFNTPIRRSVLIPECVFLNKTIVQYRKTSPIAKDFLNLAREVERKEKR